MQLILRVQSPGENRSVAFRAGQLVQIGRTEWANLCLPGDPALADVHCEISLEGEYCRLKSLTADAETLLNGVPIQEAFLKQGDVIVAGASQFAVEIRGRIGAAEPDSAASPGADSESAEPGQAAEICARCDLTLADFELADAATCAEFIAAALQAERFADATKFIANALDKPEALWWATCCVEQAAAEINASDAAAIAAARAWIVDNSDDNRRTAGAVAGPAETAAAQVALATFWSDGSIAGPDDPDVAADEGMTHRMVSAAVLQASFLDQSKDPVELIREFCEVGLAVAAGENRWA